nr:hypothetical protein GCM10020092_070600 [Actinoplanes digitatis]
MTPFIGVRISWLIVARKADFAVVAATASSRADAMTSIEVLTRVAISARSDGPVASTRSARSPRMIRLAAVVTRPTGTLTARVTVYPTAATTSRLSRDVHMINRWVASARAVLIRCSCCSWWS